MVAVLKQVTVLWRKKPQDVYKEITIEDVKCESRKVYGFYNKHSLKYFIHVQN